MFEDFRLRIFMTLAEEGSFTKTALRLGISQPAVSQNMAELEKMLSRKLFSRDRNMVSLTKEGEVFRAYAEKILASYASAERMFTELPGTLVKVSASEEIFNYFIAPRLQEFMDVHQNVSFERCLADAPDLQIILRPESESDTDENVLLRMKVSLSDPAYESKEHSRAFELIFRPSAAFECTAICRLLKEYLTIL